MSGLRDDDGREVVLGAQFGTGGEGLVYAVQGRPDVCAKIYKDDGAAKREAKVRAMLRARPAKTPALAWPETALQRNGVFVGYVMPMVTDTRPVHDFLVSNERMLFGSWISWADLHVVAAQIAEAVEAVHRVGHCICDINEQNLLIWISRPAATIIDTDSFQISAGPGAPPFRSSVISDGYVAPELAEQNLEFVVRTPQSDTFALAVIVYKLLMNGWHPFDGVLKSGEDLKQRDEIKLGKPAVAGYDRRFSPTRFMIPNAVLNRGLRKLFARCFHDGATRPDLRPSAGEWLAAIQQARSNLVRCRRNGYHWYDKGVRRCPWCSRYDAIGIDLFPPDHDWQRSEARALHRVLKAGSALPEGERAFWYGKYVLGRLDDRTLTEPERTWLAHAGTALGLSRARAAEEISRHLAATGSKDLSAPRPQQAVRLSSTPPPAVTSHAGWMPPPPAATRRGWLGRMGDRGARGGRFLVKAAVVVAVLVLGLRVIAWGIDHRQSWATPAAPIPVSPPAPAVDASRALAVLRSYYHDVDAGQFEARKYFAPRVSRYILMRDTTPQEIDRYMHETLPRQYKDFHLSMTEASLAVEEPGTFTYDEHDQYYQVALRKHRDVSTRVRAKFDRTGAIEYFEQFAMKEQ